MTKDIRINSDRMLASFNELASIGATAEGGVHRPAFSEAHLAARRWYRQEIERSGLEFQVDGAGNHSAVLTFERSDVPTLLIGSHLDSVPNGGRFDGALGVMAALEVLRTVRENAIPLRVRLEAIDFTDEEGTLVGLLGSAAVTGHLHPQILQNPRGGRETLLEGMERAGLSEEDHARRGASQRFDGWIPGAAHRTGQTAGTLGRRHWDCFRHRRHLIVPAFLCRPRRSRRHDVHAGSDWMHRWEQVRSRLLPESW